MVYGAFVHGGGLELGNANNTNTTTTTNNNTSNPSQQHHHHQLHQREFLRDILPCRTPIVPDQPSFTPSSAESLFFREIDVRRPTSSFLRPLEDFPRQQPEVQGSSLWQDQPGGRSIHQQLVTSEARSFQEGAGRSFDPVEVVHEAETLVRAQRYQHEQTQQPQQLTDTTSTTGTATCKECGNQAKKDCQFQRCRTCCKNRSFVCETHVKSTWVPAALRRREHRFGGNNSAEPDPSCMQVEGEQYQQPKSKRSRSGGGGFHSTFSASSSGGSQQESVEAQHSALSLRGQFPVEVQAPAVFKCVKLTSIEDGEDEFAYQTTVRIGGHVFKGVLHDRGVADETPSLSGFHLRGDGLTRSAAPGDHQHNQGTFGQVNGLLQELRDGAGSW